MEIKEVLQKLRSVELCLTAHPDCEKGSEFEDRVLDLQAIQKALIIDCVVKPLKDKHSQTFDEFMIGICKNRGITLTNNYTKETVGFDTLIEKWKATNT